MVLGVARGMVLSGKSGATQVCSSEHLRTRWHRKRNQLAEKEQPKGEEEENQNTELLESVKRAWSWK